MTKGKKKFSLFNNLRYKYRLVIVNDDTFEQKASLRLSKFNLYIAIGSSVLLLTLLITSLIAFTNLKYYLPGVGTINFRNQIKALAFETDSLKNELNQRNQWISNFQQIVAGDLDSSYFYSENDTFKDKVNVDSIDLHYTTDSDQALRAEVEANMQEHDKNNTSSVHFIDGENKFTKVNLMKKRLVMPLDGIILQGFDAEEEHFGIDIAGAENTPIQAVADGTVILSEWNPNTGYVIAIQHDDNLISFYKHNSALLKKSGTFVRKGDAIAIIGNTGELSSGYHLHFEIWDNGHIKNPLDYIKTTKNE